MRIGRTIPPAAAPLCWTDFRHAVAGACSPVATRRALEADIRSHFGIRHARAVSSGTAALTLTLKALKSMSPRREVVLPAFTCFSVPAAVAEAGLRPVLCDIDASTYDFDHALLERTVGSDTLCVLAHHLFGSPSDVARIRLLCAKRGAFVVEDAAQAMGMAVGGRALGTLGDVGIFSFGRGKNVTCGSGGVIVTDSEEIAGAVARECTHLETPGSGEALADFVRLLLLSIFIRPRLYWIPAALPFLRLGQTVYPREIPLKWLSGVKAGVLRNWKTRLARSNRIRADNAAYFRRSLACPLAADPAPPYLRLPVLAASREERQRIHALSQQNGWGLSPAYPTSIDEIPEIRHAFDGQRYPCAKDLADRLFTIPTHHWLSEEDRRAISDGLVRSHADAWRQAPRASLSESAPATAR